MSDGFYGAYAGGALVANTLQALDTARFVSDIGRLRDISTDNGLLRQAGENLILHHNRLVRDHNDLLRRAQNIAQEAERRGDRIVQLEHELEQLRAAKADSDASAAAAKAELNQYVLEDIRELLRGDPTRS